MKSLPIPQSPLNPLHADVRRLLKKYKCGYELHEVRAQFMGAIASPIDQVNPMTELKSLWDGGELPPMKNMAAANELMQVFAMGLWNQLSAHSYPGHPFELTPFSGINSDAEMRIFAQIKREEIESFMAGFFQGQEKIELPPAVGDSLDMLEDLVCMFAGYVSLPKQINVSVEEIKELLDKLLKLAEIAQKEINIIIVSTAQVRRQGSTTSRTLH